MTVQKAAVADREDVFLLLDFLSHAECDAHMMASESQGYEAAKIATAHGQVLAKDVRNNDRLIWDDPHLAATWWARAAPFVPPSFGLWQAMGVNERFRFYRYGAGQKFSQHRDGAFERSRDEMSWMTLMVYLNDDFVGGETRFEFADLAHAVSVTPKKGAALVFMHDRLHEGMPVQQGLKYVLRTDVMYRRIRQRAAAVP